MSSAVRDALEKLGKVLSEQPEKGRTKNPSATARVRAGLACDVTGPKGEALRTDMSPAVGGGATAPTPGWYLRAAVASCEATVIAMRAAKLGVTLTTLEVTAESDSDARGMLGLDNVSAALDGLQTNVRIGANGASPEQLREIVQWAKAHSPVGCTLQLDHSRARIEIE